MSRIALGLMVLIGAGCSSLPSDLEPFDGSFDYVAFDQDGTRILQGRLAFHVRDDGTFTGTWEIEWVPGADQETPVGPQLGDGVLVGTIAASDLSVDLNPLNADDNVGLQGELDGDQISGQWEYVTLAGPTASGTFTATRR